MTEVASLGDAVAERVRTYRLQRGWSVRQLAETCAALGAPQLTSASLANIERGRTADAKRRRREVSVDELAILAKALGIPPLLLLFPLGLTPALEVLPGHAIPTWAAAKWFSGEQPFPVPTPHGDGWAVDDAGWNDWETGAAPVDLYREHDRLLKERASTVNAITTARKAADAGLEEDERALHLRHAAHSEHQIELTESKIRSNRRALRKLGLEPPTLADWLTHLDHEPDGSHRG